MEPTLWMVLGSVIVGVIGYFGVRYTARQSKKASEISAIMAAPQSIASGYDLLNDDLWRSVTDLRNRVAQLEDAERMAVRKYRASIGYIRRLLSLLTLHAPSVQPPTPPAELRDDVHLGGRNNRKD